SILPARFLFICRRAAAKVLTATLQVAKKLFNIFCGGECHEETTRAGAVVNKCVRHTPRPQHGITCGKPETFVADLHHVLSGQTIEPLVLRTTRLALRDNA